LETQEENGAMEVAMRKVLAFFSVVIVFSVLGPRISIAQPVSQPAFPPADQSPPSLLTQVQATDVLADLLTYTATRADARVQVMRSFLQSIAKSDAYDQASPRAKMPPQLSFEEVTNGAVLFVQNGGDQYADPDLKTMSDSQLRQQQTTLTNYNRGQFMHILQQRAAAASMRMYLESINQFDEYEAWAEGKLPAINPATTGPTAATPDEAAARMHQTVGWIREIEWKKSEAEGLSREDFDKKWQQQLAQYRDSIAAKLDGSQRLAAAFARSQPAPIGSPFKAPPQPNYGNSAPIQQPSPAPPVDSMHTKELYQNRSLELWNRWDDNYYDTRYRR
jgi:hypothetical protein